MSAWEIRKVKSMNMLLAEMNRFTLDMAVRRKYVLRRWSTSNMNESNPSTPSNGFNEFLIYFQGQSEFYLWANAPSFRPDYISVLI